ncbi:E3 ubiquitin-protein ligase RNF31-like [Pyxicephalus adspersus]|uniref:E3 ubiquitin-protein ligase RNF31-like n=1 Tax=Pyxicephalus adspersus TaxID=30357 RepID=UPI003B5AE04B
MKIEHVENNCLQIFIHQCFYWLCCKQTDSVNTDSSIDGNTDSTIDGNTESVKAVNTASERRKNFTLSQEIKQEIYERLCKVNNGFWSPEEIKEAVSSCPDYQSAFQYLSHECPLCCDKYPYSKFVMMTHCNCSLCEKCFIHHFSSVIKEKSIIHVVCPLCNKPELEKNGNSEESREFFNLLDTQIHHYLDKETHDLFQRKLRDRALMEIPRFSWCSHCPFGVVHEGDMLKMECPSCNKSTCFNCKQQWEDVHEIMSCEEFKLWKKNQELEEFISKNGIECPSCKFQFELWKGGCLHFKCTQCQYEFCGGCKQLFHQGQNCDFSEECQGKGLHAHHTRDCYYYLRDWSIERLQQLLQENGIQYESDITQHPPNSLRGLLTESIQKRQHDGKLENTEDNDDSNIEEKEFLVQLINANFLDPVDLYTEQELKIELQRWKLSVPDCSTDEEYYLKILKMKIKQEIPLFWNPE